MSVETVEDLRQLMLKRGVTEQQALTQIREVLGITVSCIDNLGPADISAIGAKIAADEDRIKRALDALEGALGHADEMQRYFKDVSMRREKAG